MNTQLNKEVDGQAQCVTLPVYRLSCGGGGALSLEHHLAQAPGVMQAYVNPATEMAYLEYNPALTDPGRLRAAIAGAGFGPRDAELPLEGGMANGITPTARWDVRRLALAAGLWLAVLYALCVGSDLLFPDQFQMYRFWELFLVGFDWTNHWTLLLGLVEAFLYGAFGVWAFAALYSALPGHPVSS